MWSPFKQYKIGSLFFGSVVIFITILLFIVIWVSYQFSVSEKVETTTNHQQRMLAVLSKELNSQMRSIEQVSVAMSRSREVNEFLRGHEDPLVRSRNRENAAAHLANVTYSIPIFESIDLYMENPPSYDGQVPVRFLDVDELSDEEEWHSYVRNADFAWLGEHQTITNQGQVPVIGFSRQIRTSRDQVRGILKLNVKLSVIQELLQGDDRNVNRALLDSGKRAIAFIGDDTLQRNLSKYVEKLVNDEESNVWVDREGMIQDDDFLIVWSRLEYSDWLLVEMTPRSELTAGSWHMAAVLSGIGLAAILASLFFTLLLSRKLTQPLMRLIQGMDYFRLGRKYTLPDDYKNEFGQLFQGYGRLIDRIEHLYHSLDKQHRQQRKTEIKALQANINPHFLYNTLDQVNWMAIENRQHDISRVLELMGKMLRIGLSGGESLLLVHEEVAHLTYYLQIQQIQKGDGFTYEIDLSDEVRELYIPKFTLQPFAENAVLHGFHNREMGHIGVQIKEQQEDLTILISDDGIGFNVGRELVNQKETGGYGIRNVRERLRAYFQDSYRLQIKSDPGKGTTVLFQIPKIKKKSQLEER